MRRLPTVRGTDDYLTVRAANPRTGCVSPSVYTARSGSVTLRTPCSPGEALYSKNHNEADMLAFFTARRHRLRPWRAVNAGNWWDSRTVEVERRGSDVTTVHDEGTESDDCTGGVSPTSLDGHGDQEDRFIIPMPSAHEPRPYAVQQFQSSKPMAVGRAADLRHCMACSNLSNCQTEIPASRTIVPEATAASLRCFCASQKSAQSSYTPLSGPGTSTYADLRQLPRVDLVHPSRAALPKLERLAYNSRPRGVPTTLATHANKKHKPNTFNTEPKLEDEKTTWLPGLATNAYDLAAMLTAHIVVSISSLFMETPLGTIFDSSIPGDLRWRRFMHLLWITARVALLFYAVFCVWKMVAAFGDVLEIIVMPVRTALKVVGWLLRL